MFERIFRIRRTPPHLAARSKLFGLT